MNLQDLFKKDITEGTQTVGHEILGMLRQVKRQGDDAMEELYSSCPLLAQYWDDYEGDFRSMVIELPPETLNRIKAEISAFNQQGLTEADEWEEEGDKFQRFLAYAQKQLQAANPTQRIALAKRLSAMQVQYFGPEEGTPYNPKTVTQSINDILTVIKQSGNLPFGNIQDLTPFKPETNIRPTNNQAVIRPQPQTVDYDDYDFDDTDGDGEISDEEMISQAKELLAQYDDAAPAIQQQIESALAQQLKMSEEEAMDIFRRIAGGDASLGRRLTSSHQSTTQQALDDLYEIKKANTKTARKELSKKPKAKLSDKDKEAKQSEEDRLWAMLQQHIADTEKKKEVKEANSFLKPGPSSTGKFPEPRERKPGEAWSKSETLGKDGKIYHWQDPRAKQGVAEASGSGYTYRDTDEGTYITNTMGETLCVPDVSLFDQGFRQGDRRLPEVWQMNLEMADETGAYIVDDEEGVTEGNAITESYNRLKSRI